MLEIRELQYSYPAGPTLLWPDFQLAAGEQALLLGPSGSGKSTLLHLLAGMLPASAGVIRVANTEISQLRGTALDTFRGRHIGVLPQRITMLDSLTVLDNLLFAQYFAGNRTQPQSAMRLLAHLDLPEVAPCLPSQLSQGQLQRVALARALINQPAVLLADEPTASLDDIRAEHVADLLAAQSKQHGCSLLIATHDARLKARFQRHLSLTGQPRRSA